MSNESGIKIMHDEGYDRPSESEDKLQKTEFAWWSGKAFIIFLTVSMSVMDAMVLNDIMDKATTQSEYLGKIICFGIALILNMLPLLIAKFVHQAMYKIKRGAAVWAIISTIAFFMLFAATVFLRFSYQDQYGESSNGHLKNEAQVDMTEGTDTDTETDSKGFAVVLLLSVEPLVTSLVNFGLAYISDDEVRARLNYLRKRRLELAECENDLNAYLATAEPAEERRKELVLMDRDAKKAARDRVNAKCDILEARAHLYLAEYLGNPEGASYVTAYEKEPEEISKDSFPMINLPPVPPTVETGCEMTDDELAPLPPHVYETTDDEFLPLPPHEHNPDDDRLPPLPPSIVVDSDTTTENTETSEQVAFKVKIGDLYEREELI